MGLLKHLVSVIWGTLLYSWRMLRGRNETKVRGVALEFPPGAGPDLKYALYREIYELPETNAMRALLAPGDRLLELGTAVGYVAIEASRLLGSANVVTIEANPEVADCARRNFARNNVSPTLIVGLAIAEPKERTQSFYVYDDFWSSSAQQRKGRTGERLIESPVIDANALIREHKINALICDIEGAEIALFEKLRLEPFEKLIVEFHPEVTGEDALRRTLAHLFEAGFAPVLPATSGCTVALRRTSAA